MSVGATVGGWHVHIALYELVCVLEFESFLRPLLYPSILLRTTQAIPSTHIHHEIQFPRRSFHFRTLRLLPCNHRLSHSLQPSWIRPQLRMDLHPHTVPRPNHRRLLSTRDLPLRNERSPRGCHHPGVHRNLAFASCDSGSAVTLVRFFPIPTSLKVLTMYSVRTQSTPPPPEYSMPSISVSCSFSSLSV
jgi:hypothetical protein